MRRTLSIALLATIAVQAHADLILPYSGIDATATLSSFQITKSGTAGRANTLYISNASNTSDVLLVNTVGLGRAAYFTITNAANNQIALRADSNGSGTSMFGFMTGTGRAGFFRISNAASTNVALHAQTDGSGPAIKAQAGTGLAGDFLGMIRTTGFTLNTGAAAGRVLTSDAAGIGTWQAPTGLTLPFNGSAGIGTSYAVFKVTNTGLGYGLWGLADGTSGRGVYGSANASSGLTYGGYFASQSTSGIGAYGLAAAATGTTFGVYGLNYSSGGTGVRGWAFATSGTTNGVEGRSFSANGRGVLGWASATGGGGTHGVFGQSDGTSGHGVTGLASAGTGFTYGVHGRSNSTTGRGVLGYASADTGINYGGQFETDSNGGSGVYGLAKALTGVTNGVYGTAASSDGRGVYGHASAAAGGDNPYGVRGYCSTNIPGFGVYSAGDMGASGVKPFRIDHPSDPENKYLLHYSSESPFPQNFYNGNVKTDAKGYAWVELPAYFAEINTNFKYILTVVDDADASGFVQAKISKKIRENRFQIRTSQPHTEVCWEVKADRNDLRIQTNRPTDVREKTGFERGKYQHPEYYGLGLERGIDYQPTQPAGQRQAPASSK